jgi:hypothetical protein
MNTPTLPPPPAYRHIPAWSDFEVTPDGVVMAGSQLIEVSLPPAYICAAMGVK